MSEQMTRIEALLEHLIDNTNENQSIQEREQGIFNAGCDYQKFQPCPRCSELEEENKRMREALAWIAGCNLIFPKVIRAKANQALSRRVSKTP